MSNMRKILIFICCLLIFVLYYLNVLQITTYSVGEPLKDSPEAYYQLNEDNQLIEEFEEKAKKWRESVKQNCQLYSKYLVLDQILHNRHFILNKEAHLAYCFISKAGKTTVFEMWLDMCNKSYTGKVYGPTLKTFGMSSKTIIPENTLKYLGVRHPFTRMMSMYLFAWKEFWNTYNMWNYRKLLPNYGKWKKFLNEYNINIDKMPTPLEFLMGVVEYIESCRASNSSLKCLRKMNTHIQPYYTSCSPCSNDFDFVVKQENFQEGYKYITKKLSRIFATENNQLKSKGNSTLVSERILTQNWIIKVLNDSITQKKVNPHRRNVSTTEFTREVFKLISPDLKRRLREAFYFDFLLFGYDMYEFD